MKICKNKHPNPIIVAGACSEFLEHTLISLYDLIDIEVELRQGIYVNIQRDHSDRKK